MDCIIVDDEEMSRNAMKHLVSQMEFLNLTKVCSGSIEALNYLNTHSVDLVLLDIEMPELSGLQFIKNLKSSPLIILATSKKDYAIEAFEYNVVDYLLKPVTSDRFIKAINKAKNIFDNSQNIADFSEKDHIFIKTNSILLKINIKDILWIEALGDYTVINTSDKKHVVHSTLKAIESKLSPEIFTRVHRSYIVSIDKIDSIDDSTIVMGKKLIPVGAVYKEGLMKQLNLL